MGDFGIVIGSKEYTWDEMKCDDPREEEKLWGGVTVVSTCRTSVMHYGDSEYGWQDIAGRSDDDSMKYNVLTFNLLVTDRVLLDDVELDSKGRAIITREHYSQLRKEFDRGV